MQLHTGDVVLSCEDGEGGGASAANAEVIVWEFENGNGDGNADVGTLVEKQLDHLDVAVVCYCI